MTSFMMSVKWEVYEALEKMAIQRGISVQELVRAVIIPEWLIRQGVKLNGRGNI